MLIVESDHLTNIIIFMLFYLHFCQISTAVGNAQVLLTATIDVSFVMVILMKRFRVESPCSTNDSRMYPLKLKCLLVFIFYVPFCHIRY